MKTKLTLLLAAFLFLTGCDALFGPADLPDEPPQMVVLTASGTEEQQASRFGWHWETKENAAIADSVDPLTYAYTPIAVPEGETIQLRFDGSREPYVFTVWHYADPEAEGTTIEYDMNRGDDPRFAENSRALFPAEEGIYIVEAVWPVWVKDGIKGDAIYGFAVEVRE